MNSVNTLLKLVNRDKLINLMKEYMINRQELISLTGCDGTTVHSWLCYPRKINSKKPLIKWKEVPEEIIDYLEKKLKKLKIHKTSYYPSYYC